MLSDAFLNRLDALSLRMRHAASGGAGGLRRSKALGQSVEFSDFREYVPGDDVRRIDWNAYARFDRLFIKLFMEEQEQRVNLIVDASASMGFGKWEPAKQLAQALGYLCLCGADRVTVYALTGSGERHTKPLQGRQSYPALAAFLEGVSPAGQTLLGQTVPGLTLPSGRGMSVLISDLLSEDVYQRAISSLVYRKQETSVLQLLTAQEWEPTLEGVTELVDSETGEQLVLEAGYDTLKRYRETVRAFVDEAAEYCRKRAVTHALFIPEEPFEDQMIRALNRAGLLE